MTSVAFLPGAAGMSAYWHPVAERLALDKDALLFAWPGFGEEPRDSAIAGLSDLADYCIDRLPGPSTLVAQSMGGVVALHVAARRPDLVERLVLCGTSGGLDLSRFEAHDWRPAYTNEVLTSKGQPPHWFVDDRSDLTDALASLRVPTLLLWGEEDVISPPAVGQHLETLVGDATFVSIPGGSHSVAIEFPDAVAAHIASFIEIEVASG